MGLKLSGQHRAADTKRMSGEIGVIEAVIGNHSILVGQAAGRLYLHERYGVNLVAVVREGERIATRLRDIALAPGDVIVLQGSLQLLPERLRELGCLPLAERSLRLGMSTRGLG
jgi:uncharacterized protein with PhoU and TrkA domain